MTIAKLIPHDKSLHIIGGFVLFAALRVFLTNEIALAVAASVGALKEVYDLLHPERHTCDVVDGVATAAGALLAYSCTL